MTADAVPRSREAEAAVLGALIADPDLTARVAELPDGLFTEPRHRLVLGAVRAIHARGLAPDTVTIMDELATGGELAPAGGAEYLATLVDAVPSAARFDQHVGILRDKATLRALLSRLRTLEESARNGGGRQPIELIDGAVAQLLDLGRAADRGEYHCARDLVMPAFAEIEAALARGSRVTGLPTGIAGLDRLTSGLHPGQLIVVGGRASVGKTAVGLGFARHAALAEGVPAGIFSLEMPRLDILKRIMAAEALVPFSRLRIGDLTDEEYARLAHAAGALKTAPLYVDDTADLSTIELRGRARRMVERDRVGLVVVDYLQLVRTPESGGRNREQEVAEISRTCKAIARELEIPVVALSQLSRAPTQRSNARPVLSDLRESGAIEQDADVVLFPYRPNQEPSGDRSSQYPGGATEAAELVLRKQRNGETGIIRAQFNGELMTWTDAR